MEMKDKSTNEGEKEAKTHKKCLQFQLLFYGYGKTPQPRQHGEERILWLLIPKVKWIMMSERKQ